MDNMTFFLLTKGKTFLTTHIDHNWMAQETVAGNTETRAVIVLGLFLFTELYQKYCLTGNGNLITFSKSIGAHSFYNILFYIQHSFYRFSFLFTFCPITLILDSM